MALQNKRGFFVFVRLYYYGWVGLISPKNARAHQGVCFNLPMFFVLNLHKKCQGIAKSARAVLTYAQSYKQKRFFGFPSGALVVLPSTVHKNLVKNTKT
jgi:hypothetical protein